MKIRATLFLVRYDDDEATFLVQATSKKDATAAFLEDRKAAGATEVEGAGLKKSRVQAQPVSFGLGQRVVTLPVVF